MATGETVGIVLVSHSEKLADGLRDLLLPLAPGLAVAAAGGTGHGGTGHGGTGHGGADSGGTDGSGTGDSGLGTSDERIRAAILAVDRGAGVAILADLGSAVLTVLAVLDDEPRTDVVLVDAPLVEGAVSAAVIAGTGADLPAVVAAAEEARDFRKL